MSSSARWQTTLKFNDIWCGTHARSVRPGRDSLALLLHTPATSKLYSTKKFVYAMLRLSITPGEAAIDHLDFKVKSEYHGLKIQVICKHID